MTFRPFRKIPRFLRNIRITEKLDGTNAVVHIDGDRIRFGCRTRWITPEDDNYGFAAWGMEHAAELMKLGPGWHYGEWYGHRINRGYDLMERRFALFWAPRGELPACCDIVPTLYYGLNEGEWIRYSVEYLRRHGSVAVPGYMNPEGIIIEHDSGAMFKLTLDGDRGKHAQKV